MSTPAQTQQTTLTVAPKREIRVVEDESPASYMLDTAKFEHCYRVAEAMSRASLLPRHLKGANPDEARANCFLVVNQAMAWKLNPFLIMGETYEVQGKLGFQGKLIISVMNTRAGLREKLAFDFNGKTGDDLAVTVSGRFIGEDTPRTVTVSVGQAKTANQMWLKDPEQKLIYTAAIRWARRYAPEVVMGVMIEEDMEAMREEAHIASLRQAKSPVFEGPEPKQLTDANKPEPEKTEPEKPKRGRRPTLVEEPLPTPASSQPEPASTQPEQATAPEPTTSPLLKMATDNDVSVEQLNAYLLKERWIDAKKGQKAWSEMSSLKIEAFIDMWQKNPDITNRIKKVAQ